MKITALYLFIAASLFCCCFSQNKEQILFAFMREVVGEIKALAKDLTDMNTTITDKLDDLGESLNALNESQNILRQKVQDMETQMNNKTLGNQGCSKNEKMMEVYMRILDTERSLLKESSDQNLQVLQLSIAEERSVLKDSINQTLQTLQETITEETALLKEAVSQTCTRQELQSLQQSFTEVCIAGTGVLRAGEKATINCQRMACDGNEAVVVYGGWDQGSTMVPSIGCIKRIEKKTTYNEASAHCASFDAQLVVPELPEDLGALQAYVTSLDTREYHWIGMRARKWMDGRDVAPEEWHSGQPNDLITECGLISGANKNIYDEECIFKFYSLCQFK